MKNKIINFFKSLIPYIIIIVVVVLIRTFIVTPVRVDGLSMYPTLNDNQILLLNKFDKSYDRFDIVVFKENNDKLVKRIIGVPGDKVYYKDNKLYINNSEVTENFKHAKTEDFSLSDLGYEVIPDDMYLVLGDNRVNSLDSRFFGLISKDKLKGIVGYSIYPFKGVK